MAEKGTYDRHKFLAEAQEAETQRLAKEVEWNKKNETWIKEHGALPFQTPRLIFDGK
jgi:hypothetical protein